MANTSTRCPFQHAPILQDALRTFLFAHWSSESLPTIKGSCVNFSISFILFLGSISQLKLAGPTCSVHRSLFLIKQRESKNWKIYEVLSLFGKTLSWSPFWLWEKIGLFHFYTFLSPERCHCPTRRRQFSFPSRKGQLLFVFISDCWLWFLHWFWERCEQPCWPQVLFSYLCRIPCSSTVSPTGKLRSRDLIKTSSSESNLSPRIEGLVYPDSQYTW